TSDDIPAASSSLGITRTRPPRLTSLSEAPLSSGVANVRSREYHDYPGHVDRCRSCHASKIWSVKYHCIEVAYVHSFPLPIEGNQLHVSLYLIWDIAHYHSAMS